MAAAGKIKAIQLPDEVEALRKVINRAFITVADDLELTKENAPTNPAFIDEKQIIKEGLEKGVRYWGYYMGTELVGCYALERGDESTYYLERLGVLPEKRHHGIGKILIHHAFSRVMEQQVPFISIGIIDSNKILKDWYADQGFEVTGKKIFDHLPFDVCFMRMNLKNYTMPEEFSF